MDITGAPTTQRVLDCYTCCTILETNDFYKAHFKSDWHIYNLKRKVAEFPPISLEEFQQKVASLKATQEIALQDKSAYCQACKKSFHNHNSYTNHLNSKKHKEQEKLKIDSEQTPDKNDKENEQESDIEEVDSDEWDDDTENPIDNNDCLFCLHHSRNFYKNLEHMTLAHSFFIPDIEYCVDVMGLLRYLAEKVNDGFMCLWCNEKGRTFHSADAARRHMIDKGHCRMIHEGLALAEYVDYFDYSSSYPDSKDHDEDEEEDEGADDEKLPPPQLGDSEYQLVLPSGVVVGHRSLMRYYRQSHNPTAVVVAKNTKKLHKVLQQYRALGWTATQQKEAARKARDLHFMKRMQAKHNVTLGVRANKFQKHFRQQTNY